MPLRRRSDEMLWNVSPLAPIVTLVHVERRPLVLLSVLAEPVTVSVPLVVALSAVPLVTDTAMSAIAVVPMAEPLMPLPAELVMMKPSMVLPLESTTVGPVLCDSVGILGQAARRAAYCRRPPARCFRW